MLALAAVLDVVSSPSTLACLLLVIGLWGVMLRPDAHDIVGHVWRAASGRSAPSPGNANPLMPGLLLIALITCTFMLFFNLTNILVRPGVRLGRQTLRPSPMHGSDNSTDAPPLAARRSPLAARRHSPWTLTRHHPRRTAVLCALHAGERPPRCDAPSSRRPPLALGDRVSGPSCMSEE